MIMKDYKNIKVERTEVKEMALSFCAFVIALVMLAVLLAVWSS